MDNRRFVFNKRYELSLYALFCQANGINIISSYILNLVMPVVLDNKYLPREPKTKFY